MWTWAVSVFSSLHRLALQLVTLIASCDALSTMVLQFLEEILWEIETNLLHISSTTSSCCCGPGTSKICWASCVYFLVALITDVGHQDMTLESPAHPVVDASGFLAVPPNFDISIWLVPGELLGLLFDDLGLYERSDGGYDTK